MLLASLAVGAGSPAPADARTLSLEEARHALRSSDIARPIWFPHALPSPFRGRPLRLSFGLRGSYLGRVAGPTDVGSPPPTLTFGRVGVFLVDVRAFCLARGGRWRVWTRTRRRSYSCREASARTVYFVRSGRVYDVSVDAAVLVSDQALRHTAAQFGRL